MCAYQMDKPFPPCSILLLKVSHVYRLVHFFLLNILSSVINKILYCAELSGAPTELRDRLIPHHARK